MTQPEAAGSARRASPRAGPRSTGGGADRAARLWASEGTAAGTVSADGLVQILRKACWSFRSAADAQWEGEAGALGLENGKWELDAELGGAALSASHEMGKEGKSAPAPGDGVGL